MTDKEKARAYDKLLVKAKQIYNKENDVLIMHTLEDLFPEIKESENEKVKKGLIDYFSNFHLQTFAGLDPKKILAWLEKQCTPAKLSEEEQNRFAKGVLRSCAMSFIDYLDAHKYEGKMCVSNGECEDIENAFCNAMWDRLHRYYCKYTEEQNKQKPDCNHGEPGSSTDKPKPRFKAGQTIVNIYHNPDTDSGPEEIKEVTDDKYIFEGGSYIMISEQDYWKLDGESKFKPGEWIAHNEANFVFQIISVGQNAYEVVNPDGYTKSIPFKNEEDYHLWTIHDVKDGDLVVEDKIPRHPSPFIAVFKAIGPDPDTFSSHCFIDFDGNFNEGDIGHDSSNLHPATKEQRDLLFSKMKEGGYEWSEETKELEEIEKNPVKPKFHEGEWVISNTVDKDYRICKITGIKDGNYTIESTCGCKGYNQFDVFDKAYRPWTIEDVKDGEILAAQECYVIFKEITGLNIRCYCTYHYMGFSPSLSLGTLHNKAAFHPATKEESDTLWKAITNGGLKWNAEKKEFTAIKPRFDVDDTIQYNGLGHNEYVIKEVHYPTHYINELGRRMDMPYTDANFTLVPHEDNRPEWWSEDDEQYLLVCKNALSKYQVTDKWDSSIISQWLDNKLKSLKDRAFPQQQEWSEEDENNINSIVSRLEVDISYWESRSKTRTNEDKRLIDWLKSLRSQPRRGTT